MDHAQQDEKYVRRSRYAASLSRFLKYIERDRLGVFFFDDVRDRPEFLMRQVLKFIGVDPNFVPTELETPINKSQDYRSVMLYRFVAGMSRLAKKSPVTREFIIWIYRRTMLRERAFQLMRQDTGRPQLHAADILSTEQCDVIAADLQHLRDELGIDFPETWTH
jgi:hypothetical protein